MQDVFNCHAQYVLENDRALLRPLERADLVHLLPYALNEPETWRYSAVDARGADGMANYVQTALEGRQRGSQYPFIVFDKKTGTYAGSTRFYDIQLSNGTLQLGYTWYGERFRGTGLNKNCKYLLLQFAFSFPAIWRVEFRADARNELSIAAMLSIGCQREGIIRSHMWLPDGSRRNSIILSILRPEWEKDLRQRLQSRLGQDK